MERNLEENMSKKKKPKIREAVWFGYIVILASLFGLGKCAQQMSPSGGERDNNAPILDTNKTTPAIPANFSTNFSSNQIVLNFNEFFKLTDPNKNIIITPIPNQKPIYRVKGKKLIIELGNDLIENTTYTINFGNAIKDITEGNIVKNFNYVFSTGNFIDSLTYAGKVYDAFTKKGVSDVTVMLYSENLDSLPFNGKPTYFVKTGKEGSFNMSFLKGGEYKAIALLDLNNNYQYNPKSESIAFLENLVTINSLEEDSSENRLILFNEDVKRQFVSEKKYTYKGKFNLVLNRTSDDLTIKGIDGFELNLNWVTYSTKRDSVEFWIDSNETNKKTIRISVTDKTNKFNDTSKIAITQPKKRVLPAFGFSNNAKKGLNRGENVHLFFSQPLASADASKIELLNNDNSIPFSLENSGGKEAMISAKWKEGAKYAVTIFPEAFTSIYGETTDTLKFLFKYKEEKDYGKLYLNLELKTGNYIVQLLQGDNIISETSFSGKTYKKAFEQLNLGKYDFRLIYDLNKNGKWDTGDYLKKKQPERVELYNKKIAVRLGWDIDVTWEIE